MTTRTSSFSDCHAGLDPASRPEVVLRAFIVLTPDWIAGQARNDNQDVVVL
jgi:hypothetical protein